MRGAERWLTGGSAIGGKSARGEFVARGAGAGRCGAGRAREGVGRVGRGSWAAWERREGSGRGAGLSGWAGFRVRFGFLFSSPLFFSNTLKLFEFKHKFEFKSYALNHNKTMLQHECTNKLNLR